MDYVVIAGNKFEIELAISSDEQQRGFMYREPPFLNVIAFPFARPSIKRFWMHQVKAPLDILYCYNNKISSIWNGEPYSTKMLGNDDPCDLVLEFPGGTCQKLGIKAGDDINLQYSKEAQLKLLMLKTGLIF